MTKKLLITVIVLMAFQDKIDHKTQYVPGDELQVDQERADDLVSRGLAEIKEEQPKKPVEEKNPKTETVAAETPAPGEEKKEEAKAPVTDNPEKKQEDEPGTEKQ